MKSQNKLIQEYLKSGNRLTPLEALKLFNCLRLGARIYELKREGYRIQSKIINIKGKRVAEYYI